MLPRVGTIDLKSTSSLLTVARYVFFLSYRVPGMSDVCCIMQLPLEPATDAEGKEVPVHAEL